MIKLLKDITVSAWELLTGKPDQYQLNAHKTKQRISQDDPTRYDKCLFCGCEKWEHYLYVKNMDEGLSCSVTRGKPHRTPCPKKCSMFLDAQHHQGE